MKVRVEVVCLNAAGDEQRRQVLTIERRELAMERSTSSMVCRRSPSWDNPNH